MCATAREDGKILVNELWVDDSLEHRAMADASRASSSFFCRILWTFICYTLDRVNMRFKLKIKGQ